MRRRTRTAPAVLAAAVSAALTAPLVAAQAALGAAGGGSSGFSGGGGGGGFSGGGGSDFSSGGGSGTGTGDPLVVLLTFLIIGGVILAVFAWAWFEAVRYRRRRAARAAHVRSAALAAAADDSAFHPDTVAQWAEYLFREIQAAWDARDRERLAKVVAPELMKEWALRLDDFDRKGWHNRVVVRSLKTAYVGLVNREDDSDDRVVVHVNASVDDYVIDSTGRLITHNTSSSRTRTLDEWWTLGKRDKSWTLLSIEQDLEGRHHMESELIVSPEDDRRLADRTLVEMAAKDKALPGFRIAELADLDFDGTAHAAALDLSLADGRFAPDVIEVAVRHAVAGWVEAVDGEDGPLERVATPEALQQLLHPGDPSKRTRLVVRGLELKQMRITALDAAATPPLLSVEVHVRGRRYVENRDTAAVVSGSQATEVDFVERWRLALDDSRDDRPWQIVDAKAPPVAEPA